MKTVIEMAKEAGFYDGEINRAEEAFERFAELVRADEREACAKLCEDEGLLWGQRYAAAIRARGETK